jgi:aldose 1-epimerase
MTDAGNRLVAGELEAVFLPGRGMLGVSLKLRGEELLRRLENLEAAAAKGGTAGIPLLYPWANRLASSRYRVAGREVMFDPSLPILHCDEHSDDRGHAKRSPDVPKESVFDRNGPGQRRS